MNNETVVGIDIGTDAIKIIVTEKSQTNEKPNILHAVSSPSHGFRGGYISDTTLAFRSVSHAINKAEKKIRQKIERARFSLGGRGLQSHIVKTKLPISKEKEEITYQDIESVLEKSEQLFLDKYHNEKILHIIPIEYFVDGEHVLGNPVGMFGSELSAKIMFVTILEHHYDAFIDLIHKLNIDIDDIVASPIADAKSTGNYRQKSQGCVIVNIGSETSFFVSFENNTITSLQIENIGSNNITNDLALGLQTSLDVADDIKLSKNKDYPKRKIDEIVYARVNDILDFIEKHLQSVKKNKIFPAGIIFSGGGSKINFLEDYTKKILQLPAERVVLQKYNKKTKRNTDIGPEFSVAYGLCFSSSDISPHRSKRKISFKKIKKTFLKTLSKISKQITP